MEAKHFPFLDIAGAPYEMGRQHGSALKDLIALSMQTFRHEIITGLATQAGIRAPSFDDVLNVAFHSLPLIEDYAPDIVEEMRGIAAGSGFSFEEILALNSELDILEQLLLGRPARSLTFADLANLHRDHDHAPDMLCQHDHPQYPDTITLASLIMQPAAGRLWAAYGPPCRHEFVEYTL